MSAREQILKRIQQGLGRGTLEAGRRAELKARLAQPPRGPVPARTDLDSDRLIALFVEMAEEAAATVVRLPGLAAVPGAVASYISEYGVPPALNVAPDPDLLELDWSASALSVVNRPATEDDRVGLATAFAGIAETGTLMLLSGPEGPTTLNFLPQVHMVVLPAQHIVGPYEDAWDRLRASTNSMPRTVNLITGPSRSADIEQTLQMGAHGPVALHILLVDG